MKALIAILAVGVSAPISLWLQYQILKRIDASELMWFLYWVNLPVLLFVQFAMRLLEKKSK